ncbi:MAG: 30S ribosomal protein S16 [Deltaproteobacteria bacterium]|nr:30S ribosomal protein S16 [Deltaproteobacteria bacterium]
MGVKIRLTRKGTTKRPFYRIVIADSRSPRDGKFLDIVGTYDPSKAESPLVLKKEKIEQWVNKGATATDTIRTLFKKAGVSLKASKAA